MTTWVSAIVETRGRRDLAAILAAHRITLLAPEPTAPWLLVSVDHGPVSSPAFCKELSRELHATVIGFALQSVASAEVVEHWQDGQLRRKLEFVGDEDTWLGPVGEPQSWEPDYFFEAGKGTGDGEPWPANLALELTEEDRARYESARGRGDAMPILDLLSGGSTASLDRLCRHFGVDPSRPSARAMSPKRWGPWLVVAGIVLVLTGAFAAGALSGR